MTARFILFWVVITVVFWGLAFISNGLFFDNWGITWAQGLIGVLIGLFAGAFLDLFISSLSEESGA